MKEYAVPIEVQSLLSDKVNKFNKESLAGSHGKFFVWIRGKFIYLSYLYQDDSFDKVGRLRYDGDIEDMEFAIFKYSNEQYSADEIYNGTECLDGTIEGAMSACLIVYPLRSMRTMRSCNSFCCVSPVEFKEKSLFNKLTSWIYNE